MTSHAIRPVTEADAELLFTWRNDPETLRWSRQQQPVSWDDHLRWLRATCRDDQRVYRVVLEGETPVASVRYDRLDDAGHRVEISVLVAAESRGRGIGSIALKRGEQDLRCAWPDVGRIVAVVNRDNVASRHLFERDGYRLQREDQAWLTLAKTIDLIPPRHGGSGPTGGVDSG